MIIFTDLDGCLLNKGDYQYAAARPVVARLQQAQIPLILCSSKTQAEMRPLADDLNLSLPLVCENGGVIVWGNARSDTILGVPRETILAVLQTTKAHFRFRSFTDLGVAGVMQSTDLPQPAAQRALQRQCNEPLLWDDDEEKLPAFRDLLSTHELELSRGGRFWHVAGRVDKGDGLNCVVNDASQSATAPIVAIGDSPIDIPMLQKADIAVVIPQPNGEHLIKLDHPHLIQAPHPGSAGWATVVSHLLNQSNH